MDITEGYSWLLGEGFREGVVVDEGVICRDDGGGGPTGIGEDYSARQH